MISIVMPFQRTTFFRGKTCFFSCNYFVGILSLPTGYIPLLNPSEELPELRDIPPAHTPRPAAHHTGTQPALCFR